jgi:hypothetical protein
MGGVRAPACLLALAALAAAATDPVRIPEVVDLANAKDPLTGKPVVVGQERDWRGVRVHFASEESAARFAKEPGRHVAALGISVVDGKTLSVGNATCPVTGKPADRRHFVDRAGVRVFVATAEAREAFDPGKHWRKLGYRHVPSVVDLRNTTCPVTGDACYPEAPIWAEHDGIRVRLCCDHCVEGFAADPARCFRALMVDPAALKESVK